jgi:Domain of unknown function (DUF4159)
MKNKSIVSAILIIAAAGAWSFSPVPTLRLALLKYAGGGDWYNDVNSLKNLAKFCNDNLRTNFDTQEYATVESGSAEIFNYPIIYATGHGNMLKTYAPIWKVVAF